MEEKLKSVESELRPVDEFNQSNTPAPPPTAEEAQAAQQKKYMNQLELQIEAKVLAADAIAHKHSTNSDVVNLLKGMHNTLQSEIEVGRLNLVIEKVIRKAGSRGAALKLLEGLLK